MKPGEETVIAHGRRAATKLLLLAALAVLAAAVAAGWYLHWRSTNAAMLADFAWFQRLGFPDLQGKSFVRVYTGIEGPDDDDGNPLPAHLDAFLLASSPSNFTVFASELDTKDFTPDPPGSTNQFPVHFDKLNLRAEASNTARLIGTSDDDEPYSRRPAWGYTQTDVFVLAYACWRNGLNPEARRLYDLAKNLPIVEDQPGHRTWKKILADTSKWVRDKWKNRAYKPPSLRESLSEDIAETVSDRLWLEYANGSIQRPQLLEQLTQIARNFPATTSATNIAGDTNELARMIAEDRAHIFIPSSELVALPVETRVRELIFQLRDDRYLAHGYFEESEGDSEFTNSPGQQLVQLRYAAVPQLIEALDNTVLTRTCEEHGFDDGFVTVGNAAGSLLYAIAGRSLGFQDTRSNGIPENAPSPRRLAAREWWAEFQARGERKMLELAVLGPSEVDAAQSAALLAKRYPDSATPVLLSKLAQGTIQNYERTGWLEYIASTKAPAAIDFLSHEMTNGADLNLRLAAARGLLKNGRTEAIPAMIKELQKNPPNNGQNGASALIDFLANTRSLDAIAALRTNFHRLSPESRGEVLNSLRDHVTDTNESLPALSPQALVEIESTFIEALTDASQRFVDDGWTGAMSFSDDPISYIAAARLAELWPAKYKFDQKAFPREKERQRCLILNRWRQDHQLPTLPLPSWPASSVKPSEANMVATVDWAAKDASLPSGYVERVEKWKGKPFNSRDLVRLLADFAVKPPKGIAGFEIRASKGEDLAGVRVILRVIPGKEPARYEAVYRSGREVIGSHQIRFQDSSRNDLDLPSRWVDVSKAIDKATSAPPQTPYEIGVRLMATQPNP